MQSKRNNQTGHAISVVLVGLVLIAVGVMGWWVHSRHQVANSTTARTAMTSNSQQAAIGPGNDNSSLNNDLQSVSGSMNQESNDSTTANNGLQDQQNQISVPTN